MNQCLIELPDSLWERARQLASQEHTSVNQFLIQLISKHLTAWTAAEADENLLSKRANLAACRAVLAKVPAAPVEECDRIDS